MTLKDKDISKYFSRLAYKNWAKLTPEERKAKMKKMTRRSLEARRKTSYRLAKTPKPPLISTIKVEVDSAEKKE